MTGMAVGHRIKKRPCAEGRLRLKGLCCRFKEKKEEIGEKESSPTAHIPNCLCGPQLSPQCPHSHSSVPWATNRSLSVFMQRRNL